MTLDQRFKAMLTLKFVSHRAFRYKTKLKLVCFTSLCINSFQIQSENIMRIIRKVKPDSRAPVQTYLEQYKCGPQKDLKSNKVSESSPEQDKIIPLNLLFEGAGEQWSRELRGIVKVELLTSFSINFTENEYPNMLI